MPDKRANELAGGKEGWIHGNIGNIYKNQGFYSEAIAEFKEALALEPDSQYAHERLAEAQKLESEENENLGELLRRAKQNGQKKSPLDSLPPVA